MYKTIYKIINNYIFINNIEINYKNNFALFIFLKNIKFNLY